MDDLRVTFIVGFSLFVAGGALTLLAYAYYLYRGYASWYQWQQSNQKSGTTQLMWLKTQWLYVTLFTVFFFLSLLYMSQYLGQGLIVRIDGTVVLWERTLVWAVLALCFAYQATNIWDNQGTSNADVRSFFIIFYSVFVMLFLFAADLSQTQGTQLLWILASLLGALVLLALWLMPHLQQNNAYGVSELAQERQQNQVVVRVFMFFVVAVYVLTFIVWFLSASNHFTDAINARGEAIAYLVIDLLLTIPLALFVIWRTFIALQYQLKSYDPQTKQAIALKQRVASSSLL
jgi:hypothetical protein